MSTQTNGINMLDVKKANRSSILWAVYYANQLSRKDIAAKLGLTPAAITLITTDLIAEGLLVESATSQSSGQKGRKQVLLTVNKKAFGSIGVYISQKYFRIACVDLDCNIRFDETVYTADCHGNSDTILKKVISILHTYIQEYDITRSMTLLGIGVCVHGSIDKTAGMSLYSYGIWEEKNVPVVSILREAFGIPVILSNNICALALADSFLKHNSHPADTLFIKYGPGVGAARLNSTSSRSIFDYRTVELGHMMVDPNGNPCICGSRGCLETIAGYSAIEKSLSNLVSESQTPILAHLCQSNPEDINMKMIMESFNNGEKATVFAIQRAVYYLSLCIRNAIHLFRPKKVILYGEYFENAKFSDTLKEALDELDIRIPFSFSPYSKELSVLGAATIIISEFFEKGGTIG